MKDWLDRIHLELGSYIVVQHLIAIGYKHNRKKVLFFMATSGSGNFEDGITFKQRYPDKYGNLHICENPRQKIISQYLKNQTILAVIIKLDRPS